MELVKPLPAGPTMVVFLDPGLTTGYAYYTESGNFHSGEEQFQNLGTQFEVSALTYRSDLWVGWENFLITPHTHKMHGSTWALEVIGMIRYLANKYECTVLPAAAPSARQLGSLQKLKEIQWHRPNAPHANDAASHLLAWFIREHRVPADLVPKVLTPCEVSDEI